MNCKEISADWAAQRIKGLSLGSAIKNALLPKKQPKDSSKVIKTLINCFKYPRKGPGMMWEECARKTQALGGRIEMGRKVVGCSYNEVSVPFDLDLFEISAFESAPDACLGLEGFITPEKRYFSP